MGVVLVEDACVVREQAEHDPDNHPLQVAAAATGPFELVVQRSDKVRCGDVRGSVTTQGSINRTGDRTGRTGRRQVLVAAGSVERRFRRCGCGTQKP